MDISFWCAYGNVMMILATKSAETKIVNRLSILHQMLFNIAGNNHRLITAIHYNTGKIFILKILTHTQYDKPNWKKEL